MENYQSNGRQGNEQAELSGRDCFYSEKSLIVEIGQASVLIKGNDDSNYEAAGRFGG